jgi:hypothetical protein
VEVVNRIEGGNMETHPLEDISYMLMGGGFLSPYLRFSGSTPMESKILVPIPFMVVTIGVARESGVVYMRQTLVNGNICLR